MLADESLDVTEQVRLAFKLLDLLHDYWVTCEIRFADRGPEGPLPVDVLWEGHRRRLEAGRDAEAVTYSLWTDWFEDRDTAAAPPPHPARAPPRTHKPGPHGRKRRRKKGCTDPVGRAATRVGKATVTGREPKVSRALSRPACMPSHLAPTSRRRAVKPLSPGQDPSSKKPLMPKRPACGSPRQEGAPRHQPPPRQKHMSPLPGGRGSLHLHHTQQIFVVFAEHAQ